MPAGMQHHEEEAVGVAMGDAIPENESGESQQGLRLQSSFI